MNETFKLSGMQRSNIELERQRHLANWLVKSSPHMAAAAAAGAATPTAGAAAPTSSAQPTTNAGSTGGVAAGVGGAAAAGAPSNSVAAASAAACNGGTTAGPHHGHHHLAGGAGARKPKLRRFNSHDTSSNMFSVAEFENARLARRNEIELSQRLARRLRSTAKWDLGATAVISGSGSGPRVGGAYSGFCGGLNGSGDYSTGDSKASKGSSESQQEALPADVFLERNTLPRVARILHMSKNSNETLQSSSSHGSSTAASSSSSIEAKPVASGAGNISIGRLDTGTNTGTGNHSSSSGGSVAGIGSGSGSGPAPGHQTKKSQNSSNGGTPPGHDELFLLYRLVRQRNIYHGHNAKSQAAQRKKTVLIPQEFSGYFSLLSEKGLPTATQYGSLMQLVRERVYKFASVDNMPAFTESSASSSTTSPTHEGCLPIIIKGRPQYIKTTARGGQVFRLLAVFEDGKQEQQQGHHGSISQHGNASNASKSHTSGGYLGREKEKNRYAQLLNDNRQVFYVPLSTKGKFYEIEPGIPQLLQKLGDAQRKLNPECVHRLGALVAAAKQLPLTLRYISGPGSGSEIPEQLCITQVSKEDVVIGCSIEDVDAQTPLQLKKFYPSRDVQLVKSFLGFDTEQRMLANTNVQNMLKFCQFNCDPFLKLVEIDLVQRADRSGSKNTREGLRILKPLHLPKILRREKSTMAAAHEKEDSIIFLSKSDLENLEEAKEAAKEAAASANRISERMKVFQSTKKKWFGKHHPQHQQQQIEKQPSDLNLDEQTKRMSMERYTDMSKLLQERFGSDHPEQADQEDGISLNSAGASDTETTTLTTMEHKSLDTLLQKSMSLQDIELLNGSQRKPARPDLLVSHSHADVDAISEAGTELDDVENQTPPPQSFITEKLYNEFHVKTRQYSKSSSSLHQMRHFSLPQKLQLHEAEKEKRHLMQLKASAKEPVTGRRAAGGVCLLGGGLNQLPISPSPFSLVEDDLPYSSVRDSLVNTGDSCLRSAEVAARPRPTPVVDYTKENIYAEICPPTTQPNSVPDDDGDYASLKYPAASSGPQSVSRIEVNGVAAKSGAAISYHTVYLGEMPLGERLTAQHITTVELAGEDNIYNTLK